jgi:hypothetical protein
MASSLNTLSQVHVTKGSGKMKDIPSINTSSLENQFCIAKAKTNSVCAVCYSNKLSKLRPSLENRLIQNSALLSSRLLSDIELPVINARFIRFSSYGELENETHYMNLVNIAKRNPFSTFALWTKRADIVMKHPKEPNIKYIYSVSEIDGSQKNENILAFFDKTFTAVPKGQTANCHGACIECLICYTDNNIKHIREIVK